MWIERHDKKKFLYLLIFNVVKKVEQGKSFVSGQHVYEKLSVWKIY